MGWVVRGGAPWGTRFCVPLLVSGEDMQIMHIPRPACPMSVQLTGQRFGTCELPVSRFCLAGSVSAVVASGLPRASLVQGVGPVCWLPVPCALLRGWNRRDA